MATQSMGSVTATQTNKRKDITCSIFPTEEGKSVRGLKNIT